MLTSSVIPRLRVALSVKSIFIVNFLFHGPGCALNVNEFQVWRLDRRLNFIRSFFLFQDQWQTNVFQCDIILRMYATLASRVHT